MSLAETLSSTVEAVRAAVPPAIFAKIGQSIGDLQASGQAGRAAKVGQSVQLPVLAALDGSPLDLAAVAAGRPVVLTFYRGGWCPYCNIELRAYAERAKDFAALGASVVAISPELPKNAETTASKNEFFFPLAIDVGNAFARKLGLAFALPRNLRPSFRQIGIDIALWNGDETHELPIPATYVLDRAGVIRWAFVDADFTRRADPEDVIAALRALA